MNGELSVAVSDEGTGHLAYVYGDGSSLFSLCGLHKGLEAVVWTLPPAPRLPEVTCRRCRQAGAENLRERLVELAEVEHRRALIEDRIRFLRTALHDLPSERASTPEPAQRA